MTNLFQCYLLLLGFIEETGVDNDTKDILVGALTELYKSKQKLTDFTDDKEKMRDFFFLTKEEFLKSYSYLTEIEYDLTVEVVQELFR